MCILVALPASVGPGAAALHELVHPCASNRREGMDKVYLEGLEIKEFLYEKYSS